MPIKVKSEKRHRDVAHRGLSGMLKESGIKSESNTVKTQ